MPEDVASAAQREHETALRAELTRLYRERGRDLEQGRAERFEHETRALAPLHRLVRIEQAGDERAHVELFDGVAPHEGAHLPAVPRDEIVRQHQAIDAIEPAQHRGVEHEHAAARERAAELGREHVAPERRRLR